MLPSRSRLSRHQFEQLLTTPGLRVAFNRLGTLKYIPSPTPAAAQFAVVVSSKHEKRAVARNALRRRLYTLFRQVQQPISGILYVSKAIYAAEYPELKNLFNDLIAKTRQSAK